MAFIEKLKTSRNEFLYLVRGEDDDEKCWHYIIVEKIKLPMFKIRVKSDFINLAEYGQIIESGWGENPPNGVAAKIKQQYS